MAKKEYWDKEIDRNTDWGGDDSTNNLPVKGSRVQEFIKKELSGKMGLFYYDESNNRYLVFSDSDSRDLYLEDPINNKDLLLGNFDAPFNYAASIDLITPNYVSILSGTVGNEISFTFDVVNKQGASVGDDIICTYTFVKGVTKKTVSARYKSGTTVTMNIDKYISDGTNNIIIGIVGENTLAATTISVTYQVVNLSISSDFNISTVYSLRNDPNIVMEVPFKVSGVGIKTVEWYIDGVKQEKDIYTDEITQGESERTKYISLSNYQQGVHTLQLRVYVTINEEKFYSKTLYYEFIVYTGADRNPMVVMSSVLPVGKVIEETQEFYATQYENFDISLASYNPTGSATTNVDILFDDVVSQTLETKDGEVYNISLPLSESGSHKVSLRCGSFLGEKNLEVSPSSLAIEEINNELEFYLSASEKSNASSDRSIWKYGNYRTTFEGFTWTEENGWNNGVLVIPQGSVAHINYAPLETNSITKGKTIEIEIGSKDVLDDDVELLNLMTQSSEGIETGILITASEAKIKSTGKKEISTKYKSEEIYRIAFVINKSSGVTDKGLVYIYVNGIRCGAVNYQPTDDFISNSEMIFRGSPKASVLLRSIRVYNTALNASQLINNYALYQKSPTERISIVKRNDVLDAETGTLSYEKLANQLPVLIITGDIPTLEATTDKKTAIIAQVQYINNQNPSYSFTATKMKITPQGTSSMSYPKKNYKLYTTEDYTKIYDSSGKEIKDKLYSFKPDAIPVNCWCLKADYAESSGTHNTGIARLWNDVLKNAQIDGEYVFRTEAQKLAKENGYNYDVRTTVDGFPIVVFYRLDEDSDLVFLGKYNFNNDKSTENVFGFRDIPGFDNTRMQCWEVLNNGNDLALFKTTENFDTTWSEAFESRYPDTKNPNTLDLLAFSEWMSTVSSEDFKLQKWNHLDVYKVAAYYIYFTRFGAVDQTVKNAMFTSEDGVHFYFINYDNDTINALRNDGLLVFPPDITRESLDPTYSTDVYCYAGHESRLWNMLEADEEFMNTIVPATDNALYAAGLTYKNVIDMFDTQQSSQWCERVYNEDSQYKYIQPYTTNGTNNLPMLQGDRKAHRQWWLSKRFAIYDAKWVTGEYKSGCFEFKCSNGTPAGLSIGITSGYPLSYGFGINNVPQEKGVELSENQDYRFTVQSNLNIGDPVRIYAAYYIKSLDLSEFAERLTYIDLKQVKSTTLGTKLTKLVIGKSGVINSSVDDINGLINADKLESIDIQGFQGITSLNLSNQKKLNTIKAFNSGLTSIEFSKGAPLGNIELPTSVQAIVLNSHDNLSWGNIQIGETNGWTGIRTLKINGCPMLGTDFDKVLDWYTSKTTEDKYCTLELDNIVWKVTPAQLISLGQLHINGGNLRLKGKITLTDFDEETIENDLNTIKTIFGEFVFNKQSDLYIFVPDAIFLVGPADVLEGGTYQYEATVFSENKGTVVYSIISGSTSGLTLNSETGELTVALKNQYNNYITIRAMHTPTSGAKVAVDKQVYIKNETYPTSITLSGSSKLSNDYQTYTASIRPTDVTGKYHIEWSLTGDLTNYAEIIDSSDTECTLHITNIATDTITGTLGVKVIKDWNNSISASATMNIQMLPENILMTSTTNPEVMRIMYNAGLAANSTYMTKEEAAAVTLLDIQPGGETSSIFYNKTIYHFEEFQAFTGLQEIPTNCFYGCYNLTSVTIPNSVTSIGGSAFRGCYNLTSVTIPNSVTSIGDYAFRYCSGLTTVQFNAENCSDLSGYYHWLFDCNNITSFTIGENVKTVPASLCYGLSKLTSVVIPNSVTSIGGFAFKNCSGLTSVTIPNSVTSIGDSAFENCSGLTSVTIPNSVTSIGGSAFSGCSSLESIVVESGNSVYDSRDNCNAIIKTDTNTLILGCKNTIIPNSVTSIGDSAFRDCSGLTSVTIPNSVTSIGGSAFENCSGLTSVTIPNSVTSIGGSAFRGCSSLTSITISDSITKIERSVFKNCTGLTSINIPNSVTKIGDYAFESCSSLTSITIPNSVTEIGSEAFLSCTGLISLTIPDSVTSIRYRAFRNCYNLELISVESGNSKYDSRDNCNALIETSTNALLYGCANTIIPNSVTSIDSEAFSGCRGMTSITIPDSVTEIGIGAFYSCSITSVTIGNSVTSIQYQTFQNCTSLTSVTIGNSVTSIGQDAFYNCSGLTSIIVPNSVTSIEGEAFYKCTSLTSVTIGNSVASIGRWAFLSCTSLTNIIIPDSVTSIKDSAFYNCTSLTSVTIGKSVTSIEYDTFSRCTSLSSIRCLAATAPTVSSDTFGDSISSYTGRNTYDQGVNILYVPVGATGYEDSYWLDPLQNEEKCGFTISYTL